MALIAWLNYLAHEQGLLATQAEAQGITAPEVMNLEVPLNDPTFTSGTVLPLVRALFSGVLATQRPGCRRHQNQVSGFLDGQAVIGDASKRKFLRQGSLLRTSVGNLMPFNDVTTTMYSSTGSYQVYLDNDAGYGTGKFVAGDKRSTENAQLAVIQTLLLRWNNLMATNYRAAHPTASDEEVFNAAAAMLAAQIQVITYREVLPQLLGCLYTPSPRSSRAQPSTSNRRGILHEFTTAAFRITGHTAIPCYVPLINSSGSTTKLTLGASLTNIPKLFSNGGFEQVLRGMIQTPSADLDRFVCEPLRSLNVPGVIQRDLIAADILRFTETGGAPINTIREHIGLPRLRSWRVSRIFSCASLGVTYQRLNRI